MTRPPDKLALSHVGFFVQDLEKMRDFYVRILGFQETDRGVARGAPIVFLSRDPGEHHQIVFAEGRTGGLDARVVNQISLRAGSLQDLRDMLAAIEAEPEVTDIDPTDHGTAWSLYFRDPEGNRIEVFVDTPWYVEQPVVAPLDLSKSDDEIAAETKARHGAHPSFRPAEEWRDAFSRRLDAALGS